MAKKKLTQEILSGQDRLILPARVANQNADFSYLARSLIIKIFL